MGFVKTVTFQWRRASACLPSRRTWAARPEAKSPKGLDGDYLEPLHPHTSAHQKAAGQPPAVGTETCPGRPRGTSLSAVPARFVHPFGEAPLLPETQLSPGHPVASPRVAPGPKRPGPRAKPPFPPLISRCPFEGASASPPLVGAPPPNAQPSLPPDGGSDPASRPEPGGARAGLRCVSGSPAGPQVTCGGPSSAVL